MFMYVTNGWTDLRSEFGLESAEKRMEGIFLSSSAFLLLNHPRASQMEHPPRKLGKRVIHSLSK